MHKFLIVGLVLIAFAFVTCPSVAKEIRVTVTKGQVSTVCNGADACAVSCGFDEKHECRFKCIGDTCTGSCPTCRGRSTSVRTIRSVFPVSAPVR